MTPLLLSLLLLLVKSLCVFALAGLTLFALRRASAASRHLVCLLTLCALLALPLFSWTPLSLPVSVPTALTHAPANLTPRPLLPQGEGAGVGAGTEKTEARPLVETEGPGQAAAPMPPAPVRTPAPHYWGGGASLLALWLLGVLAAALRPLLGLWGIGKLGRSSRAETSPAVLTLAAECAAILGLPRVPAIRRGDVPVPITWGLRRPVVLLPDAVDDWPDGRLRAVLLHELAHIRRRDWAAHRLADLTCALYWFHPLVWLTARRLRDESELACDDLVLSCGIPAPDYARHLLDIARALSPAKPSAPTSAIGMARTVRVEGRITQMLNPTQNRRALPRRTVFAALLAAALGVGTLAALRPAAKAAPPASSSSALRAAPVSVPVSNSQTSAPVPIQFVGVGDLQKHEWWSKTGALLPKPIFDFAKSPVSGDASQPGLRGLLFAFRLPPAAQDVTVGYNASSSRFSSSAGAWVSKSGSEAGKDEAHLFAQTNGMRVLKADFPASAFQTDLRVGIASGPWQTKATAAPSTSGQMSGSSTTQADNTVYIIGTPTETTDGTVCTVSVGHSPAMRLQIIHNPKGVTGPTLRMESLPSRASGQDIRLVALNAQGQKILPSQIGDDSANSVEQITAHFSLPPSQIKKVILQTRPFTWVEFKNIALQPLGAKDKTALMPGVTPAETAAATARLHQIYGFLQAYRRTHSDTFPVRTTTLIQEMVLNPKLYGLSDQGLGNQAQALHFFTSPDSRFMDGNYKADQIIVYFTHNKRPDKTMVGTAKSAGTRDVFAYTNLFVRNHLQRTSGFYLVLWDDGTVSQIAARNTLAVPAYDIIGPAGSSSQTRQPLIKQIAFPGQAGLPHG